MQNRSHKRSAGHSTLLQFALQALVGGGQRRYNLCMVIPGLGAEMSVQHCKITAQGRYGALLIFKELTAADETTPSQQFGLYDYIW